MQFKNFLNLFESYLSNKSFGLNENLKTFFEGQQETFALSLLNNDQNLLSQLKTNIEEKHLPVAAYWLSKGTNINQVLEIMKDYIELADKNIIKANVTKSGMTLDSKKTKQEPMPDFIYFVNTVRGIQQRQKFNNPSKEDIEIDAENLKILHQQNNITVYEANSPQACVKLGKGQSFCISKPAGTMWQSYRDTKTSTFHFVKDQNRDSNDPLRLVVVDMTARGIELTDTNNRTGNIAEYGNTSQGYFQYLKKMGVPTEIFKNMPKTPEEIEEEKLLGRTNKDLNWFKGLDIFQQSKYIGRGHQLTDEQFDYLWNENEQKLLNQYVSIGRALNSYQLNKIASKTSLKNSYFRAREQAVSGGHGEYAYDEYLIMSPEQQEVAENKKQINFNTPMIDAAKKGDINIVKSLIEKGANKLDSAMESAFENGHLDIVKLMIEKGAKKFDNIFGPATFGGHLDIVKLMIEKGEKHLDFGMSSAARGGHIDIVKLMIEKGATDFDLAMLYAAQNNYLDIVKLMIEKGANGFFMARKAAEKNGHKEIVDYIRQFESAQKPSQKPAQQLDFSLDDFGLDKDKAQQPAQQPAQPWLSRMRSKVGI